jgi:hypothetical protein
MDNNYNISSNIPRSGAGSGAGSGAMIGVILVLILLAILVYVKPSYFKFLFKTFLGNLIVAFIVIVISIMDIKWGIGIAAIAFIVYQAFKISCIDFEGFVSKPAGRIQSDTSDSASAGVSSARGLFPEGYPIPKTHIWPENIIADFVKFQKVHNPNLRFDLDIIQKQATAQEALELIKTSQWPWSKDVQNMYKQAIQENNIINTEPGASLNNARTVYNQAAIMELLSWNSKEGSFLINGAIICHNDDMPANINNLVRCGKNSSTGDITMEKIVYTGYNGIYGNMNSTVTPVSNSDLPKLVNGFKFLGGECNPCVALDDPANYSCPFSLNTGNGAEVSPIWQKLWGVNAQGAPVAANTISSGSGSGSGTKKTTDLTPDNVSKNLNKNDFPLLNQLKDEIMKSASLLDCSFKKPPTMTNDDANISSISGSSVPAILSNVSHDKKSNSISVIKNSF